MPQERGAGVNMRQSAAARPTSRVRAMLALFHRLAIAIVAVIVCMGIAGSGRGTARLIAAAFDATARETASADRSVRQSEQLRRWQGNATRQDIDLKAVESDGEEDDDGDDPRRDVTRGPACALRCAPVQHKPDRTLRGVRVDTSRFTARPRLPRGPPTLAT